MIRFPSSTSKSDKVLLRGSAEDIEKAKERLMELTHEKVQYLIGHSLTLRLILLPLRLCASFICFYPTPLLSSMLG